MPQFDDNPYGNPNMGGNLFNQNVNKGLPAAQQAHNLQQQGWDAQSPMNDWQNNIRPDQAQWQGGWNDGGGAPGRLGQRAMWNSQTGDMEWVNQSGVDMTGITGTNATSLWKIDPVTGNKVINMEALRGMAGGSQGGYQKYGMSDYGGGDVAPGEGWGGYEYKDAMVDPSAVIAAQEYQLQDNMQADFAQAGARSGASGFDMSTPYTAQLGEAARKASQDRNAIAMQYQYDASSRAADREQQQEMQSAQHAFGGWDTGYQGDLQSQMFNEANNMNRWQFENQLGFQDNQGQNQWNQNNQYNEQQMLMSLMGGLF